MSGWKIPSGPSNEEFFARVHEIQASIESGTDGKVARQHLVAKALLKNFAAPVRGQSGLFLVPHHVRRGRRNPLGTTGCAYKMNFLQGASKSAEMLWQTTVEDRLSEGVRAARRGKLHENEDLARVLKLAMALHYVRSHHWREVHDWAVLRSATMLRDGLLTTRSGLVDDAFTNRYGLLPAGPVGFQNAAPAV